MTQPAPTITPMMAQFLEIKEANPGALLFYRMGDFYEMFFDDAVEAAAALGIALTKRGKHEGKDIPMCGVPVHAAEGYLLTLIRKGFRVGVCEQLEDPSEAKKRGSKAVVKRDVVRLVTPGTLTEDTLLDARQNNYLAAFSRVRDDFALAWTDISTGEVWVSACPPERLGPELARLAPAEVLVAEGGEVSVSEAASDMGVAVTSLALSAFDSEGAKARLAALYSVATLDAFGQFDRVALGALGALVQYLELTQKGKLPMLRPPVLIHRSASMQIDAATRRNLELTHALSGGRAGSLLSTIDRTVTAGGARLLDRRLASPSCDYEILKDRLEAVAHCVGTPQITAALRERLRRVPDIDRALGRIALDRGGPRDMAAIRNALEQATDLAVTLGDGSFPRCISSLNHGLLGHDDLLDSLDAALIAEPPLLARDGGFIAPGHDKELDEARTLRDEGRGVVAGLQATYAETTGIASLKVKHNNVLGYFIETTATHAEKMLAAPLSELFIHRQTTANAVRFTTTELAGLETKILNAGSRALEIEKRLFLELRGMILEVAGELGAAAQALAELDVITALADLALEEDWCRPVIDGSLTFEVEGGRHPVVEAALRQGGDKAFVANDCMLGTMEVSEIRLLTGPNMAGKSTYLRQNALIAILAQIGSYVPARSAHIGLVSSLFSRVGASDDLARGRSTFMVEMVETAAILNQADERSLVILDEIGRGTATYDGLSIAWATLEHLHEVNGCRGLFATHYHEMTHLSGKLDRVKNATVAVKEWDGDVIFLHEVKDGAADRSYGVQVARLAGLPDAVVARAREVLERLEAGDRDGKKGAAALIDDLPLFASTPPAPSKPKQSVVEQRLRDLAPDALSPLDALNLVYELKQMLGQTPSQD